MKTYSFKFVIPKDFVNDYIKVEADNPKVAKDLILEKLGKKTAMVSQNHVPKNLMFLPGSSQVQNNLESPRELIISLNSKNAKPQKLRYYNDKDKFNIIVTPENGHFEKKDVVINKNKEVQIHLCKTTSMCPIKAIYSKYITPITPHQNDPNAVKAIPLLKSLFLINN